MKFAELVDNDIQYSDCNYCPSYIITTIGSRLSSIGRFAVLKEVKLVIDRGWYSSGDNWMVKEEQDEENSINPQLNNTHFFFVVVIDYENKKVTLT